HVDAAASTVGRARRNATLSGLQSAPIRWISEDVRRFVRREIRRGARYEVVILDPPAYGHGKRGETWRIAEDLPGLLDGCAELTGGRPRMIVLSAHSPGYDGRRLSGLLRQAFGTPGRTETRSLSMERGRPIPERSACRRFLDAGELAILECDGTGS
ncbi:MAG: class I SAM-dependent rRNA methyltransferase, partial [Planctomycetia bacterium]|nr:class I SAM-dependent rRNA methyltransferase [Planctomycetia bacterium]